MRHLFLVALTLALASPAGLEGQQTRDSVACVKCVAVRDSTRDSTAVVVQVPVTSWRVTTRVSTTFRDSVVRVPVVTPPPPPPAPAPALIVTATPTAVVSGGQVSFAWRATGISGTCTVSDGRQTVSGQPLEASHQVAITSTTTLTVRCGSLTRSATATVIAAPVPPPPPPPAPGPPPPPPPPPGPVNPTYPNRPASYSRVLSEYFFSDPIPLGQERPVAAGWTTAWNEKNLMRLATAADAPVSPSSVLEWAFTRTGTRAGHGVGIFGRALPAGTNQVYVAFWLWHDPAFEFHPISNKLLYLEPGNLILQSRIWEAAWLTVTNSGGNQELRTSGYTLPLGRWVQLEYLVDAVADRIKLWADGRLVIDAATSLAGNYRELKLDSTWGGSGGTKTRDSFRRVDHILVATP